MGDFAESIVSKRHDNKRAARIARGIRWELVHAAGCTERGGDHSAPCPSIGFILAGVFVPNDASHYLGPYERFYLERRPFRVSVPRSLRPILGRYLGA